MAENHHSKPKSGDERLQTPPTSGNALEERIAPVPPRLDEAELVPLSRSSSASTRAGMDVDESTQHASDFERQIEGVQQLPDTLTSEAPSNSQTCVTLCTPVSRISGEAVREGTIPLSRYTQQVEIDSTVDQPTRHGSHQSTSTVESTSTGTDNTSTTTAETAFDNNEFPTPSFGLNQGSLPASDDVVKSWKLGQPKK